MSLLPTCSNLPQDQPGSRHPLTFLHCPTNRQLKGTEFVVAASERLKDEGYDHSLIVMSGAPHEAVLEAMQAADVVIDQLLIGWYGMVAVEAWAYGKPVICYIRPDLYEEYYVPARLADQDTITDAMKSFLMFPDLCGHWGRMGRAYVVKVHTSRGYLDG